MDSGVGGLSILNALLKRLPEEKFIYLADYQFLPYGEKSADEICLRCEQLIQVLSEQHEIKAVVLACNSATAASISYLRKQFPFLFFGTEPGIKPAAKQAKEGIVVLATELTLGSENFKHLIKSFTNDKPVYNLPAPELVYLVEEAWQEKDKEHRQKVINELIASLTNPFDILLLGCTHFNFLKNELEMAINQPVTIIDTSEAIASWVEQKLNQENLLASPDAKNGVMQIYLTGDCLLENNDKINTLLAKSVSFDEVKMDPLNLTS